MGAGQFRLPALFREGVAEELLSAGFHIPGDFRIVFSVFREETGIGKVARVGMLECHIGVAETDERNGPCGGRMGNQNSGFSACFEEDGGDALHQVAPREPVPFITADAVLIDIARTVRFVHVPDRETVVDVPETVEPHDRHFFD
ncbi:hypothetical protein SDC9_199898 [bioreactor metagenome]|uniref:Uncharacterized protein n=1 Tax=bioreactor metagenome TaxID=1076179 RepID=A0A645IN17_9ZZZZ